MSYKIILISLLLVSNSRAFVPYPFLSNNILEQFLQTVKVSDEIDLKNFTNGTDCYRECVENDRRTCHFYFNIKSAQIMGG